MSSLRPPTAWEWFDDRKWVAYDKKTQATLEKAYREKTSKEVKTDAQRFVDLDFADLKTIADNFVKMDNEKQLVGIQRRYDDRMRRRAVRRRFVAVLEDVEFVVLLAAGAASHSRKSELVTAIEACGGKVAAALSKSTDYALSDAASIDTFADDYDAFSDAVDFVDTAFLQAWFDAGKMPTPTQAKKHALKPTPKQAAPSAATTAAVGAKKKKAAIDLGEGGTSDNDNDDDEPDEGPPKPKRQRTTSNASAAASSSSSSSSSSTGSAGPAAELTPPSEWSGLCRYAQEAEFYVFTLTVLSTDGDKFEGRSTWPTLGNASCKVRGTLDGAGALRFEEYSVVRGGDEITPGAYVGTLVTAAAGGSRSLKGAVLEEDAAGKLVPSTNASFELKYVRTLAPAELQLLKDQEAAAAAAAAAATPKLLPSLVAGARVEGECVQRFPFVLHVDSSNGRNGDKLTGRIEWTTLGTTTTFVGSIAAAAAAAAAGAGAGPTLLLTEEKCVSGNAVDVPTSYALSSNAKQNELRGTFGAAAAAATRNQGHMKITL